jgi:hypothetical protein
VTLLLAVVAGGCGAPAGERFAAASVVPGAPQAPDFTLTDPGGRRVRFAGFRGLFTAERIAHDVPELAAG